MPRHAATSRAPTLTRAIDRPRLLQKCNKHGLGVKHTIEAWTRFLAPLETTFKPQFSLEPRVGLSTAVCRPAFLPRGRRMGLRRRRRGWRRLRARVAARGAAPPHPERPVLALVQLLLLELKHLDQHCFCAARPVPVRPCTGAGAPLGALHPQPRATPQATGARHRRAIVVTMVRSGVQ